MKREQRCDMVRAGPTGETGRYVSETVKLEEEFDRSRTEVPETVAPAQAGSTLRRFYEMVRFPRLVSDGR
jgi:hypothetical protein